MTKNTKEQLSRKLALTIAKRFCILLLVVTVILTIVIGFFQTSAYFRESLSYTESDGAYILAEDLTLHIHERGKQHKQTILFVHGLGSWGKIWDETTARLEEEGFHTVAVDMPPFGFSEKPINYLFSTHDQVKRLTKLIETLGLEDIVLVGHSFAGEVTIETARSNQDKIKTLVLVDTGIDLPASPPPTINSFNIMNNSFVRNSLTTILTHPWFTKSLLTLFIYDKNDATVNKVHMLQEQFKVKGTSKALSNLLYSLSLSNTPRNTNYKALTFPTFIIWGEKDTTTPLAQGQYLRTLFPNSKLIVMPEIGHIPQIEDNEAFNDILLNLVSSPEDN